MAKQEYHRWTPDEVEILIKYYPLEGAQVAQRVNHTVASCRTRARLLGLHFYNISPKEMHWSPDEDTIIREQYPTQGGKIKTLLPGRSKYDITNRAIRLGITYTGPAAD